MRFGFPVLSGKSISQAHLHCAPAGINGPVVAVLLNVANIGEPGKDFNGNAADGEIEIIDNDAENDPVCGIPINTLASLYEAILQRRIYLNVHSEANPSGETRAQLFQPKW